jgi:uncharacterized protein with GYD domain
MVSIGASGEIKMSAIVAGRTILTRQAFEAQVFGGRLVGWYLTFGHHDWMAIGEFPEEKAAATAILAAAAGGSLSDIETTIAMTAKDAHTMFEAAGKAAKDFRSAGRS